ncbi:MAG: hypothetical protein PHT12_04815 [Patescibacteria group bacterium]|nr:hypothetical protein [Patescibacteria group bacterium]
MLRVVGSDEGQPLPPKNEPLVAAFDWCTLGSARTALVDFEDLRWSSSPSELRRSGRYANVSNQTPSTAVQPRQRGRHAVTTRILILTKAMIYTALLQRIQQSGRRLADRAEAETTMDCLVLEGENVAVSPVLAPVAAVELEMARSANGKAPGLVTIVLYAHGRRIGCPYGNDDVSVGTRILVAESPIVAQRTFYS